MSTEKTTRQKLIDRAEEEILGAILTTPDIIQELIPIISGKDFFSPQREILFNSAINLWTKGEQVDALTVSEDAQKQDKRIDPVWVFGLSQRSLPAQGAPYHAKIIREESQRRQLSALGVELAQLSNDDTPPDEIIALVGDRFESITQQRAYETALLGETIQETMEDILARASGETPPPGIKTGFYELDSKITGLKPGQMVIVAGRPGSGKSTLAVDILRQATIKNNIPALIFSLEMSKAEINERILSAEASVRLQDIANGTLTESDMVSVAETAERITDAPLHIDDTPTRTMVEIASIVREYVKRKGVELVVIDYLQLLHSGRRVENRQQEVSDFSRSIKLLAKSCGVPIIAVAQLNRGVETRGEMAEPKVSDLRESGSLEQDADMILLINRPDASNPDHEKAGEADVIVGKNRGGPTGRVTLVHQLHMSRFNNPVWQGQGGF